MAVRRGGGGAASGAGEWVVADRAGGGGARGRRTHVERGRHGEGVVVAGKKLSCDARSRTFPYRATGRTIGGSLLVAGSRHPSSTYDGNC
jgi:hypothetical protein